MLTRHLRTLLHNARFGATRRELFQRSGWLAIAGLVGPAAGRSPAAALPQSPSIPTYESLGVRPMINARGTVTIVGATRVLPEVKRAMEAATSGYVQLDELMEGVGKRLAELTGTEWGIVTSGCSAALVVATAGCITGGDPDKMAQLPDLTGLKDEVIMPTYSRVAYDHAIRAAGARIIEVQNRDELEAAIGPRTAMIMVLAGGASENGPLSLRVISSLAQPRGVPILVDSAADELVVPNPYVEQGAQLVAYSGGKCLRGPQCAGLLIGRKDLVQAAWINSAPHHGLGRGYKVGREEIMGMLAAVEMWHKRNHAEEWKQWTSWLQHIAGRLEKVPGVATEIAQPRGRSNRTPSLRIQWDMKRIPLTGHDVEMLLYEGEPRIAVSGAGSFLPFPPNLSPAVSVVPYQLAAGEERIIADRLYAVLSNPPPKPPRTDRAASEVSGQWDVQMRFTAGAADHSFVLEQRGTEIAGTHYGSFAARDLAGTLRGSDILLRSSYTRRGVRLNFTFTGAVQGDKMAGSINMGEYGMAEWSAVRHTYASPGRDGRS